MLERYADIFVDGLGSIQHFQAKLQVKDNTRPVFHRPRPVPLAVKGALEDELKHLQSAGIIEKVPIVMGMASFEFEGTTK